MDMRFFGREVDYEAMKKNGFHDQQVLVVDINDKRLAWQDRELLTAIGKRLYGDRPTRSK